jgi:hypothetical protein
MITFATELLFRKGQQVAEFGWPEASFFNFADTLSDEETPLERKSLPLPITVLIFGNGSIAFDCRSHTMCITAPPETLFQGEAKKNREPPQSWLDQRNFKFVRKNQWNVLWSTNLLDQGICLTMGEILTYKLRHLTSPANSSVCWLLVFAPSIWEAQSDSHITTAFGLL